MKCFTKKSAKYNIKFRNWNFITIQQKKLKQNVQKKEWTEHVQNTFKDAQNLFEYF